ncbi:MAG: DUF6786 family protein [Planctomycetota bacterium]|jgi:hypothetical protein
MIDTLTKSLQAARKTVDLFQSPDGTRLLLLPYGARILGLYSSDSDENFYWTNSDLEQTDSAKTLFECEGWQNTGGDRTWLTPELDIFFPDYPKAQQHWEPPELDASEYSIIKQDDNITMTKLMTLYFARPDRDVELELTKKIEPAPHPLRYEGDIDPAGTEYAGYSQRTTLELCGDSANNPVPVGIWNLIQLPHGGELLVPTYAKTKPRILFGDIPPQHLICLDRSVRFKVDFPGEHKIAIRAAATTGRAGYIYPSQDRWSLVVRNFTVNPSGEYIDVPKDDPEDFGYSVHAVNVKSALGDFCELEYHAPAIGHDPQRIHTEDISQVWAFRGPEDNIRAIAHRLLGT